MKKPTGKRKKNLQEAGVEIIKNKFWKTSRLWALYIVFPRVGSVCLCIYIIILFQNFFLCFLKEEEEKEKKLFYYAVSVVWDKGS